MKKQNDIIYDLISFIQKMKEKDRIAFRKFIANNREKAAILRMFRAFEKCNPFEKEQDVVKRLLILQGGSDERIFKLFKQLLFEFELTSKRVRYFKNEDSYNHLLFLLMKEFLAAQILTERDAYITSVASLHETFRKAKKFEFLQIQKDCAKNLKTYHQLRGNQKMADQWSEVIHETLLKLIEYQSIHHLFERKVQQLNCCNLHRPMNEKYRKTRNTAKVLKIKWMKDVIAFHDGDVIQNAELSFKKTHSLYKVITRNPGIFPRDFRVIITRYVFEDLYRLGSYIWLSKFAMKIHLLDDFPIYQRIPLIHFFIHFLLKSDNQRLMDNLLENLYAEEKYFQFSAFSENLIKVEAFYYLRKGLYHKILKIINRSYKGRIACEYNDFEFRFVEILAHHKLNNEDLARDRIESLRKFIFRNDSLRLSSYHIKIYKNLRSLVYHEKLDDNILRYGADESVYDLRKFMVELFVKTARTSSIYKNHLKLFKAAENGKYFN